MSFAAAVYDAKGKDVVIGTDRRWCTAPDFRFNNCFSPIREDAVKCLRLSPSVGIAFTGAASLIRSVLARVYADPSIERMDELEVGELLEGRDIDGGPGLEAIRAALDSFVGHLMAEVAWTRAANDLSIFLAGRNEAGRAHVVYWCASTQWRGCDYPHAKKAVRTLPPECETWEETGREADKRLDAFALPPALRIKNAVHYLGGNDLVVSVNAECILRPLARGFRRL